MRTSLIDIAQSNPDPINPVSAVIRSVYSYFGLTYPEEVIFGLGSGIDFELPASANSAQTPCCFGESTFAFNSSFCTGFWCIEYTTESPSSFVQKLNAKWNEGAAVLQPIPVVVLLPNQESGTPEGAARIPCVLVDCNDETGEYTFMDDTGAVFFVNPDDLISRESGIYQFSTFDVPLNFIKNPKKFIPIRSSIRSALIQSVQQMLYMGECRGIPAMERLLNDTLSGDEDKARAGLDFLCRFCACSGDDRLFRGYIADFLTVFSNKIEETRLESVAQLYRDAAAEWASTLTGYFTNRCMGSNWNTYGGMVADRLRKAVSLEREAIFRIQEIVYV